MALRLRQQENVEAKGHLTPISLEIVLNFHYSIIPRNFERFCMHYGSRGITGNCRIVTHEPQYGAGIACSDVMRPWCGSPQSIQTARGNGPIAWLGPRDVQKNKNTRAGAVISRPACALFSSRKMDNWRRNIQPSAIFGLVRLVAVSVQM